MTAHENESTACQALHCDCGRYVYGGRVDIYEQCGDCHHTEQLHKPRKTGQKVRR